MSSSCTTIFHSRYIFFRLHHILCERLTKMYNQSLIIRAEETKDRGSRKESTAVALRLKPKSECMDATLLTPIDSLDGFSLESVLVDKVCWQVVNRVAYFQFMKYMVTIQVASWVVLTSKQRLRDLILKCNLCFDVSTSMTQTEWSPCS